jgi:hypothetical protein
LAASRTEAERLSRKISTTGAALVEDQVDDGQHRSQPLREQVVGREAEGDARIPDLPLRPRETRFIVSSGTRKAPAISSVVRPPSARKVSATCASSMSAG